MSLDAGLVSASAHVNRRRRSLRQSAVLVAVLLLVDAAVALVGGFLIWFALGNRVPPCTGLVPSGRMSDACIANFQATFSLADWLAWYGSPWLDALALLPVLIVLTLGYRWWASHRRGQ